MTIKALRNVSKVVSRVFGEPAIRIRFDDASELPVRVIFQESFSDMDANGVAIGERQPTAWIQTSAGIDTRDLLQISGVNYRILSTEPDGYGLLRLDLGED
ncbi:head-tail joining protein [Sulfitobacter sp. M22]|uniref:head-tail joining protein n=1 Tax=Sulfitobacter sp. M22 TaxID=2675332 RepID=UPI001F29265E|nr:hypothetical protein [Sulfitobacter sp. M22]MCF7728661.1 hypothetical protein [Sulfitobacter sp. M22]